MDHRWLTLTYLGGPTAPIGFGGARLLTDPSFNRAGENYLNPTYALQKIADPALAAGASHALNAIWNEPPRRPDVPR
jgi:hypothetical protein